MNLSAPFIQRPIATVLLMFGLLLCGLVTYRLLPVGALPNVNYPTIQISAQLPGADPQTLASSVATPLEQQLSQIPGVTQLASSSALGVTTLTIQFELSRTVDSAAVDVLSAINAASPFLPQNLPYPPTIRKVNPAETPVMLIALTSETLPLTTVDAYAESILLPKISQIPGVGLVGIGGQQKPAIRVQVNPQALAARGIGLEDVRSVIAGANVDQPKGTLNSPRQTFTLNTNDQLLKPEAYDALIIAYRNGSPVRIRDIGKAVNGPENNLLAGWYNKQPAIILSVQRVPGANVIETVDRIKALLPQLQASIPPAIKVSIAADRTLTIRAAVADVQFTLMLTVALVVMVIFLFLRNFWATVIPAVTVPLSLIGTFAVLYVLGYSLDNLSLMALSIAVGFVVDDAVVVIENIVRHLEMGLSPMEAALKGAGEIGFTIVSITLSLIAVFIPLFLMGGYVGKLFQEFAITITASLILSLIVSLTLTPMMCSRLLKNESREEARPALFVVRTGFRRPARSVRARPRGRAASSICDANGDALHRRIDGISLRNHPQGIFPTGGYRPDRRHHGSLAGHLVSCDGATTTSDRRYPVERSRDRFGRQLHRSWRPDGNSQSGAYFYHIETARSARRQRGPGHQPATARTRQGPGHQPLHASGARHHHRRSPFKNTISIHPDRCRRRRTRALVRYLRRKTQNNPRYNRRRQRPGQCRTLAQHHRQSRGSVEFWHSPLDDRQYARRRLWSAHRLHDVYLAEPISCRARSRPSISVWSRSPQGYLYKLVERPAGAVEHAGE